MGIEALSGGPESIAMYKLIVFILIGLLFVSVQFAGRYFMSMRSTEQAIADINTKLDEKLISNLASIEDVVLNTKTVLHDNMNVLKGALENQKTCTAAQMSEISENEELTRDTLLKFSEDYRQQRSSVGAALIGIKDNLNTILKWQDNMYAYLELTGAFDQDIPPARGKKVRCVSPDKEKQAIACNEILDSDEEALADEILILQDRLRAKQRSLSRYKKIKIKSDED